MPARLVRGAPAEALRESFDAVRAEAGVELGFSPEVAAAAEAAARKPQPTAERVDIPLVTIDPPGSLDLDQALHIEAAGDGHRVRYAIADVAAFVASGDPVDIAARARGVTEPQLHGSWVSGLDSASRS